MATVIAKILGDGKSIDTAFTTSPQVKGLPIIAQQDFTGADGLPVQTYSVVDVPDEAVFLLADDKNCFVLPPEDTKLDLSKKIELSNALSAQGCEIDFSATTDVRGVINEAALKIEVARSSK